MTTDITDDLEVEITAVEDAINDLETLTDRFRSGGWKPSSVDEVELELLDRKDKLEELLDALRDQEPPAA